MAVKRGGLGKGLDSLIPDHKPKANTSKDKERNSRNHQRIFSSRNGRDCLNRKYSERKS